MYKEAREAGGLAVVTGSASGVGKVAAQRFVEAGFDVLLADLPGEKLDNTLEEIRNQAAEGQKVLSKGVDVSRDDDVQDLADFAFSTGEVAVLMNNAGIGGLPNSSWSELANWQRLMDVNFFGVLRGIHAFVPRMIEAARPAVVINTGSKQGITSPPGNPAYNVSKAAIRGVSEQLAHELREEGAPISVHLFVPGFTYTGMIASFLPEKPAAAWTSEEAVDYFIKRMEADDFYILCPDNDVSEERDRKRIAWAIGDIVENRPALSRWHPDFKDAFARFEAGE